MLRIKTVAHTPLKEASGSLVQLGLAMRCDVCRFEIRHHEVRAGKGDDDIASLHFDVRVACAHRGCHISSHPAIPDARLPRRVPCATLKQKGRRPKPTTSKMHLLVLRAASYLGFDRLALR